MKGSLLPKIERLRAERDALEARVAANPASAGVNERLNNVRSGLRIAEEQLEEYNAELGEWIRDYMESHPNNLEHMDVFGDPGATLLPTEVRGVTCARRLWARTTGQRSYPSGCASTWNARSARTTSPPT